MNYFAVIWPALLFGILIGGSVHAFVSPHWLTRALSGSPGRAQLAAGLAGTPLMLCSCCVAPIFTSVYERTWRYGPSLAVMLAAPSLNPAALTLTFMLFGLRIGTMRVAMGIAAVFLMGTVLDR
ncbi:MAG: permease [Acidobacteria bacterium]|nr:permease [Acidobacteriota bacterium]